MFNKYSISLSKTDGKKNKRVKIPKLLDASAAGTKESIKISNIPMFNKLYIEFQRYN